MYDCMYVNCNFQYINYKKFSNNSIKKLLQMQFTLLECCHHYRILHNGGIM